MAEGANEADGMKVALPSPVRFLPPERAVLGILQIATDLTMDVEGARLVAEIPGVNVRMAKIAFDAEEICAETYEDAMAKGRVRAAAESLLLPAGCVTLWGVACTSLSFLIGRERLAAQLPPGAALVTMWEAVCAALRALAARRIAVLTPYITAVHDRNVALLEQEGFAVARSMHLDLTVDRETSAVDPEYVRECVKALAGSDVDAVFVGCSAFRACAPGFIRGLEADVRVPVVTSTQAFLWHALRSAGVQDKVDGYGTLFCDH